MKTRIVFEDRDVLVIYKPAGLATQTARVGQADVVSELKNYLAKQNQGQPYLGVIHRLDQPVEGLLVFAKNKKAAAVLTAQLQKSGEGLLNKQYYAVVCGKPSAEEGTLVDYLYKEQSGRAVIEEKAINGAKRAILHYKRLWVTEHRAEEISLLDIRIETGRFHQIRAQLAHAGVPILGDTKYGDEKSCTISDELGVRNVALYAYKLEFVHPVSGKVQCFSVMPEAGVFSMLENK